MYVKGVGRDGRAIHPHHGAIGDCLRCADLYFSFEDLGFECVSPYENMVELAKQYAETYGKQEISA